MSTREDTNGAGLAELRTTLSSAAAEVPRARRLIAESLDRWGMTVDRDVAALLVSELVTNAVLHGHPPLELYARRTRTGVRVEVHDGASAAPTRYPALDPESLHGRGLVLVESLASRWGYGRSRLGKQVWFELD